MALQILSAGNQLKRQCPYCEKRFHPQHFKRHATACLRDQAERRRRAFMRREGLMPSRVGAGGSPADVDPGGTGRTAPGALTETPLPAPGAGRPESAAC